MVRREQSGLDILVTHGREVASDDLEVSVLTDVVFGHLEHAEVEIGDWAEGAACDEHDGCSGSIALLEFEAMSWKLVGGERRRWGGGRHGGRKEGGFT
jgi:hypothetical protein